MPGCGDEALGRGSTGQTAPHVRDPTGLASPPHGPGQSSGKHGVSVMQGGQIPTPLPGSPSSSPYEPGPPDSPPKVCSVVPRPSSLAKLQRSLSLPVPPP